MKINDELRTLANGKLQDEWIPLPGDMYAWNETCTRHGDLLLREVISYDVDTHIIHGLISYNGPRERRWKADVFWIPRQPQYAPYRALLDRQLGNKRCKHHEKGRT